MSNNRADLQDFFASQRKKYDELFEKLLECKAIYRKMEKNYNEWDEYKSHGFNFITSNILFFPAYYEKKKSNQEFRKLDTEFDECIYELDCQILKK